MRSAADRLEFAPPQQPGLLRAFALAVLAHILLVVALTHGLHWKREAQDAAVEAELWSAIPQQAAPKEVPVPPPPPPQPVVKAPPQPEPPARSEADIAQERERQKRLGDQRRQAELERQRAERARAEAAEKKRDEELARKKEQQKQQAEAKRKEDERKARQQQQAALEEKKREQIRDENMKRMQNMAGGTGAPSATGTAARATGPSASWAGRVQARVRPNIVFTDTVTGNPKAEVEVRTSPDGTIVGKRLVRSSGVKAWDEAVLRALDKTETLPRDVDGRVPSPVVIEFRPQS